MAGQRCSEPFSEPTARIRSVSEAYGLDLDPERPVHTLALGERQRVEIVRALLMQPQLLILDEPTSVLTPQAVQKLFATLRELAQTGCSILYISHKLEGCSPDTRLHRARRGTAHTAGAHAFDGPEDGFGRGGAPKLDDLT